MIMFKGLKHSKVYNAVMALKAWNIPKSIMQWWPLIIRDIKRSFSYIKMISRLSRNCMVGWSH